MHATTRINFERIMLSERSQTQKIVHYGLIYYESIHMKCPE
jgi:hypothetical protein